MERVNKKLARKKVGRKRHVGVLTDEEKRKAVFEMTSNLEVTEIGIVLLRLIENARLKIKFVEGFFDFRIFEFLSYSVFEKRKFLFIFLRHV